MHALTSAPRYGPADTCVRARLWEAGSVKGGWDGFALDDCGDFVDPVAARHGVFVYAGRLCAYFAGAGDRGGADPRDSGTQSSLGNGRSLDWSN